MKSSLALLLIFFAARVAVAQSGAFYYQGLLTDADSPAIGVFDMQFVPFDSLIGCHQRCCRRGLKHYRPV
jgi:hypothetical protein